MVLRQKEWKLKPVLGKEAKKQHKLQGGTVIRQISINQWDRRAVLRSHWAGSHL